MSGGAFVAGSIVSKFMMDKTQWDASIKTVLTQTAALEAKATTAGEAMGKFGSKLSTAGTKLSILSLPILAIGGACTKMAIDANESENLFSVAMGEMAGSARAWSIEISKSLGLNQYEVRKMVGTFNVMLASMGMSKQGAFDMSKGLTVLANDMASLYNLPVEEAFTKLQSGISGEIEPLKRLGIIVNETTIKQWALTNGVIKQGQELTEAQKIQARYNVIMAATKAAQGDLGRTIDQTANQIRALKSKASEAAVTFGTMMIPIVDKVISALKKAVDWFNGLSEGTKKTIMNVGLFVAAAGPVLLTVGKLIQAGGVLFTGISKIVGIGGKLAGVLAQLGPPGLAAGKAVEALNSKVTLGSLSLGKLALVGGAAFVGWKIGELIGELTGLNKHLEASFSKWIDILGIAKSTAELGEKHAEMAARRQEWAALAFRTTGKEAKTLHETMAAMEPTYIKLGTTGNAQLDTLMKAHMAGKTAAQEQAKETKSAADVYGELAIDANTAKAAVETFSDYLKNQGILTVQQKAEKVKELEGRLKELTKELKAGNIELQDYIPESKRLTEEIKKLTQGYREMLPEARDTNEVLEAAGKIVWKDRQFTEPYLAVLKTLGVKTIPELKNETRILLQYQAMVTEAFKAGAISGEQYKGEMNDLQEQLRNVGKVAAEELPEAVETASNAIQEMYLDIAQGLADVIIDEIGFTETLMGEAIEANKEYYQICYDDLLDNYNAQKAVIEQTITDEQEKNEALLALDEWYAGELDRIRTDEEKAKEEAAKREEDRQNSLWGKVKTIFGEAVEAMLKTWLSRFIGNVLSSIFGDLIPGLGSAAGAVEGVGTAVSTVGGTISGVLGGLASGIGTLITTLAGAVGTGIAAIATGIGTAIVALATAIATAATTLAAATPAIAAVGAVAIALYAGFQAVNSLLGSGGGGAGDGMGRVVERQDTFLAAWGWWHIDVKDILFEELAKSDHRADQLDHLSGVLDIQTAEMKAGFASVVAAITNIPGAATGALVNGPTLVRVGENAPREKEIISPISEIGDFARAVGAPLQRERGPEILNANVNVGIEPVVIDKGGSWLLQFMQKNIDRGHLRIPAAAVGR